VRATVVLLPSPLTGPVAWEPVADVLRAAGWDTVVADLPEAVAAPDDVVRAFRAALPVDHDVVLVPHSNAGLYVPLLAAGVRHATCVFVDAALPMTPASTRLAPAPMLRFLAGLADDEGVLPPWSRWWDEADLVRLFPSDSWRERVRAAEPRLPLSYFEGSVRVPERWAAGPCAYLAFGRTYGDELALARRHGWPTEVIPGGHLHLLHDPQAVVDAILRLLARLASDPTGPRTQG
jgi:hypothetical protein